MTLKRKIYYLTGWCIYDVLQTILAQAIRPIYILHIAIVLISISLKDFFIRNLK